MDAGTENMEYIPVSSERAGEDYLTYDLLQCTNDADFMFFDYEFALKHGFNPDVYKSVYYSITPIDDKVMNICSRLYMEHNTIIRDRKGHSMSVSDIIVIHFKDGDRYFYVNSIGFVELTDFVFKF